MSKIVSGLLLASVIGFTALPVVPAKADETSAHERRYMEMIMQDHQMMEMAALYYIRHHPHMKMPAK